MKRVLEKIFDSWQRKPRRIYLCFYYAYEDVQAYLAQHEQLRLEECISCQDLFSSRDSKEKLLIYTIKVAGK